MVLKGVIWVHNRKSGYMVLKGVNEVHNGKFRSYGLERSQLGTQYKNQVIWSWKDSIVYTMVKLDQMVLKGVNWVHNPKIWSYGLERSQCVYNGKIRSNGLSLCSQLTPFKTIWPDFCSRNLIYPFNTSWPNLSLCTQMTFFKTIWPDFCIGYPVYSFQHHLAWFLYYVPSWLLSRPFDLILPLYTHWLLSRPYDQIFGLCTQLTPFKTIWSNFTIVYTIESFQDHMTWFLYCVPNWLLSRPYDLNFPLCTSLTPFKTI